MTKWEYCTVELGWTGGLRSKYVIVVGYHTPEGASWDRIDTDFGADNKKTLSAMGKALAILGEQGWEVVSMQRGQKTNDWGLDAYAFLKRPITER